MKIAIIGGGAAGIMAALAASKSGHHVYILERNSRIGKKILTTGNGRCNFTNMSVSMENYHSQNPGFQNYALEYFSKEMVLEYFQNMGIESTVEESGKIYPITLQASSFLNSIRRELASRKINILEDAFVKKIVKSGKGFVLKLKEGEDFFANKVIVTTGGKSMPKSGSDGNGYTLLQSLGHKLTNVLPGLVQLKVQSPYLKHIMGVKIVGNLKLIVRDKVICEKNGDILFTDYGVSGPTVFDICRQAQELIEDNSLRLSIPLINNLHERENFREYLFNRFEKLKDLNLEEFLTGLINKKLIHLVLRESNLDLTTLVSDIESGKKVEIINLLLGYSVKICGTQGYGSSQVTIGGIDTTDFSSETMESKLVEGLYAAGEVLDIDGDCGGYNLQWAWSSGYLAGKMASL